MTRAKRLLTLAYKAHQRNEPEIAGRIMTFAFAEPEAAKMFEQLNETSTQSVTQPSGVAQAEAALRAAEAATTGSIFSDAGASRLLAIADKAHKDGLPQIAKLIADIAS
jgi:rubrerythrin